MEEKKCAGCDSTKPLSAFGKKPDGDPMSMCKDCASKKESATPDFSKLRKFVEAAIKNPKHPVYQMGMARSVILQHYALNVRGMGLIESIEPMQWFSDYPAWTSKLQEVMTLCEEDSSAPTSTDIESVVKGLQDTIATLQGQVAELNKRNASAEVAVDATEH